VRLRRLVRAALRTYEERLVATIAAQTTSADIGDISAFLTARM